jgi:hypothetical protein
MQPEILCDRPKIRTIPSTAIYEEGLRLDCNPYTQGAFEAKAAMRAFRGTRGEKYLVSLSSVTKNGIDGIVNPGRIRRQWVGDPKFGIPFLSSTDILQADISSLALISKNAAKDNPRLKIKSGWILITRSGSVGRMAYSRPDMDGLACTEDVLRVIPDPDKIPSGYLYAYLSSKYGHSLITASTYGAIIQHIEPNHLKDLPVPRLEPRREREIQELMESTGILLAQYQKQINKATSDLFTSVGLLDISSYEWHQMGRDLGFAVPSVSTHSLRALNFNPRFHELCRRIQQGPWKRLNDVVKPGTLQRGARFKRIEADERFGVRLVGQRELFWLEPSGRWVSNSSVGHDSHVEDGTIITAAQGTLGESEQFCRAEFITGPFIKFAFSEHFLKIVADPKVITPGCLYAFFRSETAFRLLRSISTGTKLQDQHPIFRSQLPIPYPERRVQNRIHELVMDAYAKRHKAVSQQQKAIALIETAIGGKS